MTVPLTLTFTFTPELRRRCAREFQRMHMGIPLWAAGALLWIVLSGGLQLILSKSMMKNQGPAERWALAGAAVGVLILAIRAKVRRGEPAGAGAEEAATIRFTEEGMESATRPAAAKTAWGDFRRFAETESFFFLFASDTNAQAVPKNGFASAEDLAAFRSLLEGKVPRTPDRGHPILGKTRPVYYLLLFGALALLMYGGRSLLGTPRTEVSIQEYLQAKGEGRIREVRFRRDGTLSVRLNGGDREILVRVRTQPRNASDEAERLGDLIRDLPPRSVIDER